MIEVGERAPEFTLPDETGKDRSLTELFNAAGAIVLYFYPLISHPAARDRPALCATCTLRSGKRGLLVAVHQSAKRRVAC